MTPLMPARIIDYATLKQAIQSMANRSDQEFISACNLFIQIAGSAIYTDVRTPANEVSVTHTAKDDGDHLVIPDSFLEMREVYRNGLPVNRLTQDEYFLALNGNSKKVGYARLGGDIFFNPPLDTSQDSTDVVNFFFWVDWAIRWEKDTDTNPLLVGNPDLYLFGTLAEAFTWLEDEGRAVYYKGKFEEKLKNLKSQARNADQAGGTMQVRGGY